jgi:hypothetical protein
VFSECRKCYFRDPNFKNFLEGACPQTLLANSRFTPSAIAYYPGGGQDSNITPLRFEIVIVFATIDKTMSFLSFAFADQFAEYYVLMICIYYLLRIPVKNCLYLASKVKNEKSNTINRCGILLRIIVSNFMPIRQVMTEPYVFFKERRPLTKQQQQQD